MKHGGEVPNFRVRISYIIKHVVSVCYYKACSISYVIIKHVVSVMLL